MSSRLLWPMGWDERDRHMGRGGGCQGEGKRKRILGGGDIHLSFQDSGGRQISEFKATEQIPEYPGLHRNKSCLRRGWAVQTFKQYVYAE